MSESALRRYLLGSELHKKLDLQPHEDRLIQGVPDLSFAGGWLELKYRAAWPHKPHDVVTIPHFTPQQRQWARRRAQAGQSCWLMLQVKDEYVLFGEGYWRWLGELPRTGLYIKAHGRTWESSVNFPALLRVLQKGY